MFHKPSEKDEKPDYAEAYKIRLGLKMFFLYSLFYMGFIAINIISPQIMGKKIFLDLNLAVIYGFGLIIFALIFALIYNIACSNKEKELNLKNK